jgi:serine/threonine protein kinase
LESLNNSVFREAALVSGLLSKEQLDEALRAAAAATPGPPPSTNQIDDAHLAAKAVELTLINPWQAQQLKAGRTKFTLGPYHIIDSIGRGGMGHVFQAEHAMLGRIEAVKVLPKSRSTPESIANFQREIRAQAQLDHPNLVRLSYAGQEGATYFFVTEFVPGADLRRLVRRNGRLTMQQAATIISQAAEGLQHAHQQGLVHRDVKPGNLLVTPGGETKVTDLGLAGFLEEDIEDNPHAGKIVGTADYLSPEVLRSPGEMSPLSDIYSLGCTMYYAVTGKVPFPGGTTADKLRRHCEETPLHPRRFNPDLDDSFLNVLGDMMDKDPKRRIQSAGEVIRQLAPWTLDVVPNAAQVESLATKFTQNPRPVPLPIANIDETVPHFLDEGELNSELTAEVLRSSQGTDPISAAHHETLPIGGDQVVKLGLGLYVYPSHKLVPLLMLLTVIVACLLLLGILF